MTSAVLVVLDATALLVLNEAPGRAVAALGALAKSAGPAEIDALVSTLCLACLFVIAAWLALGFLTTAATAMPGAVGQGADVVSRLVLPAVLRRVLVGATGLGVVLTPACASAMSPSAISPPVRTANVTTTLSAATVSAATVSAATVSAATFSAAEGGGTLPAPTWPTSPTAPTEPTKQNTSAHPSLDPAPPTPSMPSMPPMPTRTHVHVAAGDSLWLISAQRLGPRATEAATARYWPRLYANNRGAIGDDPALIHPGQRLTLPEPTTEGLPS